MPAEQVFHVHGPELTDRRVAGHDFPDRRHRRGLDRDARTVGHDSLEDGLRGARHAENDFVDRCARTIASRSCGRSEHLPAADCPALEFVAIVDEPDDFEIRLPQLVQQVKAGLARAGQQQALARPRRPVSISLGARS